MRPTGVSNFAQTPLGPCAYLSNAGLVLRSVNPMPAIYPLHLQREIDRRWLRRSEETASVRARLKGMSDFLRKAAVAPENCDAATPPTAASSAKRSTTLLAM
jgi:hypothetical protein